jgi:hypothetical protein
MLKSLLYWWVGCGVVGWLFHLYDMWQKVGKITIKHVWEIFPAIAGGMISLFACLPDGWMDVSIISKSKKRRQ